MPLWASGYRNLLPNRRRMMEAGSSAGQSYSEKVLGYSPIAYWMLAETSGTTAVCQVNTAQNGTYARNVTTMGTGTGIGDGNTAPVFDGTQDVVNTYSATFASAFNALAGTVLTWQKVSGVGVWTDGAYRYTISIRADGNNYVHQTRTSGNNVFNGRYQAGGTASARDITGLSTTDWFCVATTWDKAADEVRVYLNGVQQGLTLAGLGVWAGAIDSNYCCIGDWRTIVPTYEWSGQIAHAVVWNSALSPAQISDVSTV